MYFACVDMRACHGPCVSFCSIYVVDFFYVFLFQDINISLALPINSHSSTVQLFYEATQKKNKLIVIKYAEKAVAIFERNRLRLQPDTTYHGE